MSTRNRERVAKDGLEAVVKMTRDYAGDYEMAEATTGWRPVYNYVLVDLIVCVVTETCR